MRIVSEHTYFPDSLRIRFTILIVSICAMITVSGCGARRPAKTPPGKTAAGRRSRRPKTAPRKPVADPDVVVGRKFLQAGDYWAARLFFARALSRLTGNARLSAFKGLADVGRPRTAWTLHPSKTAACFSVTPVPGTNRMLVGGDGAWYEIDVDAGRVLTTHPAAGRVRDIAVSDDGRFVVAAGDSATQRDIPIFDRIQNKTGGTISENRTIQSVRFTPDDKAVFLFARNLPKSRGDHIHKYRVPDGALIWSPNIYATAPYTWGVAISNDGKYFFAQSPFRRRIARFDIRTGKRSPWPLDAPDQITGMAESADGMRLLTTHSNGDVCLWDINTRSLIRTRHIKGTRATRAIFIRRDTEIAIATEVGDIIVTDTKTGKDRLVYKGHYGNVTGCAETRDGRWMVSVDQDGVIKKWSLDCGQPETIIRNPGDVTAITATPFGEQIAVAAGDTDRPAFVTLFTPDGITFNRLSAPKPNLTATALAFSPDGERLAVGCRDGSVIVYTTATQTIEQNITTPGDGSCRISSLAFIDDDTLLVGCGAEKNPTDCTRPGMMTMDLKTGTTQFLDAPDAIQTHHFVVLKPTNRILVSGSESGAGDGATWSCSTSLVDAHRELIQVKAMAASPDQTMIAAVTPAGLTLFDADGLSKLKTIPASLPPTSTPAFSPDGRYFAVAIGAHGYAIFETRSGMKIHRTTGLPMTIRGVTWLPVGLRLAIAGSDGTVRIRDFFYLHGDGRFQMRIAKLETGLTFDKNNTLVDISPAELKKMQTEQATAPLPPEIESAIESETTSVLLQAAQRYATDMHYGIAPDAAYEHALNLYQRAAYSGDERAVTALKSFERLTLYKDLAAMSGDVTAESGDTQGILNLAHLYAKNISTGGAPTTMLKSAVTLYQQALSPDTPDVAEELSRLMLHYPGLSARAFGKTAGHRVTLHGDGPWLIRSGYWLLTKKAQTFGSAAATPAVLQRITPHPPAFRLSMTLRIKDTVTLFFAASPKTLDAGGYSLTLSGTTANLERAGEPILTATGISFSPNTSYQIRIERQGGDIMCFLNNAVDPFIEYTDPDPFQGKEHNTLGITIVHQAAIIEDCRIEALKTP